MLTHQSDPEPKKRNADFSHSVPRLRLLEARAGLGQCFMVSVLGDLQ